MQLYAKIKRNSEYAHQCEGKHFPVEFEEPSYPDWNEWDHVVIGGPGGRYKLEDVNLFIKNGEDKFFKINHS